MNVHIKKLCKKVSLGIGALKRIRPFACLKGLVGKTLHLSAKLLKAIMVYKSLNGLAPDRQAQMFVDCSNVTNYTLRDTSGKVEIPQPRTDYLKNSFSNSGAVLWNSLPSQLRHRDSSLEKLKSDCNFK